MCCVMCTAALLEQFKEQLVEVYWRHQTRGEMTSCVILQLGNEETQIETIITQSVTQTRLVNTQWQTQLKDVVVVENKH